MKEKIKNYLAFASLPYRIVVFAVLPLFLLVLELLLLRKSLFLSLIYVMLLYSVGEVVADNWCFGSIAGKHGNYLEYLKCSKKRRQVVKNALMVNMLRQFLGAVFFLAIGFLVSGGMDGGKEMSNHQIFACVNLVLESYLFIILMLLIVRMLEGANTIHGVVCGGMILQLLCWKMTVLIGIVILPIVIVLAVLVSILGVQNVIRRMEAGFRDERNHESI